MKEKKTSKTGKLRPPIVVVLGHVDHGKTTLLDNVRNTKVTEREAGGITQGIGASQVTSKQGRKITFIDTPGHATFSKMRTRGAQVADIAILVVAVNDGVKPQTLEALKFIKDANIPFIVVASKTDIKTANVKTVQRQLEKEDVKFESQGGDVPLVGVSGKMGEGIDNLLEMILLVAEINEINGDPKEKLDAVVIETSIDKKGPLVSAVLRNGSLKVGDSIVAGKNSVKTRGLFDDSGKSVKKSLPGDPVQILGFSSLPPVGTRITFQADEINTGKEVKKRSVSQNFEKGKLPIVIKTKTQGALEDILKIIPEDIAVVASGVGDVNETDVFNAKSASLAKENIIARIIVFEAKVPKNVLKLADTEGVGIERFEIVYKLFDRLDEILNKKKVVISGKAKILAFFPYNDKKVVGCKVVEGKITRSDKILLMRDKKELGKARFSSMKKQKEDVTQVKAGEEFGALLKPQLDFKVGDMIVSIRSK